MDRRTERVSFPAMSTTIEVTGVGVPAAVVHAAGVRGQDLYDTWDRTFNRFRADSELSRLNQHPGRPIAVSDLFLSVLDAALAGMQRTERRFDPTILPALERAGYDRDIDAVRATAPVRSPAHSPSVTARPDAIVIDRERGTVQLPKGTRIDLGGIAKGAFVDRLATEVLDWPGGCVDAGGDIRLWGAPPSGDRWIIGIEDPAQPDTDCLVAEVIWPDVGIATSGTNRRRWRLNGREATHLIDPVLGEPLTGPIRSATVFAPTVSIAEVAAKAIIVSAARGEPPLLWGGAQAALVTVGDRPELSVTIIERSSAIHEERYGSPSLIHAFDASFDAA